MNAEVEDVSEQVLFGLVARSSTRAGAGSFGMMRLGSSRAISFVTMYRSAKLIARERDEPTSFEASISAVSPS